MKQLTLGVVTILILLFASGCFSNTGFDKRATLMPDRVGISVGQQCYRSDLSAWYGVTLNAQWDLK